jgi:NADPH2:quinone reductase
MKAIAQIKPSPRGDTSSLVDLELPKPSAPSGRDLLVRVEAISVNPVDTKVRQGRAAEEKNPRVLGWDAAGIVEAAGPEATRFAPGDAVYYSGAIARPGSNAEFQLVDERIVGRKPASLSFADAAALPLTALTAWESFTDRLGIDAKGSDAGRSLLILAGAGGVGSIGIQLAKVFGLTVIATASRPETQQWCRDLGATHVIDHRQPLRPQLEALGFQTVDFIANFCDTDGYWAVMADLIAPQGHIVGIVENSGPIELGLLKSKSASFHWESMFTRAAFQTEDLARQGGILDELATLLDAGTLRTTRTETLTPINAANLREAHACLEPGHTIGKITLAGW